MLQQTQVSRVVKSYTRFIERFPDPNSLAKARLRTVLGYWVGLGFNSRAKRLHDTVKIIQKKYCGKIPSTYDELRELPGIGDYTANALLAFIYNKPVPVIDVNIKRVLLKEFAWLRNADINEIKSIAKQLVPKGRSRLWHNALMDYGSALPAGHKKKLVPAKKQSTFVGSRRQIRGKIIRLLLQKKSLSFNEIHTQTKHPDLTSIIQELQTEKVIKVKNGKVTI